MYVFIGALVGALVMGLLTLGVFFASVVVPPLGICNCACCMWPMIGGAVGAGLAVQMSPKGGGAAKGAGTGALAGAVAAGLIGAVFVLGAGYFASVIPTIVPKVWGQIRVALDDDKIGQLVRDVPEKMRDDVAQLLRDAREKEQFSEAYKVFQQWLTDDRIDFIVSQNKKSTPKQREAFKNSLREIKEMSYEDAMNKAGPAISQLKSSLLGMSFFFILIEFCLCVIFGLFGGIVGGALLAKDTGPVPEKE